MQRRRRARQEGRPRPAGRLRWYLLALLVALGPPAAAEVIDRGIAIVGDEVVTASDVRFEQALALLDPGLLPGLPDDPVQRAIDVRLLQAMAGRLRLASPAVVRVEEHLDRIRRAAPSPAAWVAFLDRWGMTEDDLRAVLRSRLAIGAWLLDTLGGIEGPGGRRVDPAAYARWMADRRAEVDIRLLEPIPESP